MTSETNVRRRQFQSRLAARHLKRRPRRLFPPSTALYCRLILFCFDLSSETVPSQPLIGATKDRMLTTRHPFYFVAPDLLRGAALALFTVLVWCTIMNRWSAEAWRTPLEYIENPEKSNDVLFYFAEVKAAV